ncbi:MAG: GAF domain-containing protein [Myxococcales bacterium]|nr:GAF domain-containing protein [Myxococcales bacterium]
MGVQTQSALIAALLLLGFAINVAFQERRVEHRAAFTALLGGFFFYNLAWFMHSVVGGSVWLRLLLLSGVVVAQTALWFFERVLRTSVAAVRTAVHVTSAVAVVLVGTDLVDQPLVKSFIAAVALCTYGWCVWRLFLRYRHVEAKVEATRLGYLVFGGALSVAFSGLDLLPAALGVPLPTPGHLFTTVYMFFWMQVVQRSRLLDLKEILGRGLALLVLSAIVSVIYVALLIWVGTSQINLFFFNTLAASVALFFVFEPLKRAVDKWVGRLLFRETYEFEAQIRRLRREMTHVLGLEELAARLIERLGESRRVTHASVYFLEGSGYVYALPTADAALGGGVEERLDVVRGRAFLDALSRDKVLSIEQVERELLDLGEEAVDSPERARLQAIRRVMDRLTAGLSFAILANDRLLGFINVRDERTREAFSTYEIGLIAGLAAQVATVLESSEMVKRLNERDRLSAIGEMATGMAHEIRNPLGAIKAAAELLEPAEVDAESREWIDVIIEETHRLDHVLRQFLDFARPYRGELCPMRIDRVLARVATLMRAEEHEGPVEVVLDLDADLPVVIGDIDQIHQVCLNLARNACQAMDKAGGTLTLTARRVQEEPPGRPGQQRTRVEVEVRDTGPGIAESARPNLFIPFFTTKRRGTGLGLPISRRLLQHHGAEIEVESKPGEGTAMRFRLFLESDADQLTGEHRRLMSAGAA